MLSMNRGFGAPRVPKHKDIYFELGAGGAESSELLGSGSSLGSGGPDSSKLRPVYASEGDVSVVLDSQLSETLGFVSHGTGSSAGTIGQEFVFPNKLPHGMSIRPGKPDGKIE